MKKLLYFLLILFGCGSPSLEGTWTLEKHEFYDSNQNIPLQEFETPFTTWEIQDGNLKIDGEKVFFAQKGDRITITFQKDFKHFIIQSHSQTSLLLQSQDLTPGTTSFYYFLK